MVNKHVITLILGFFLFSLPCLSSPLCIDIFKSHPASRDNYRAYAIGKTDAFGVQRIHVVDFAQKTLNIDMTMAQLKDTILKREQFNAPELKMKEMEANYSFHMPKHPFQTRVEMEGQSGHVIRRQIVRALKEGNFKRLANIPKPPRYEYEPANSMKMTFLVEIKTPDQLVELVFTKHVNSRHMDVQATSYALHIANQLGLQVEGLWAIRFGYN